MRTNVTDYQLEVSTPMPGLNSRFFAVMDGG